MQPEASSFTGWAHIELYGHSREDGYVTTRYYGSACMFHVSIPEIPQRLETLTRPMWVGDVFTPSGTLVEYEAIPARERLIGPGAIYALNPTTQEKVLAAVASRGSDRVSVVVQLPPGGPQLSMPLPLDEPQPLLTEEEHDEQ